MRRLERKGIQPANVKRDKMRPVLLRGLALFARCWCETSSDRVSPTMPIPWSSIRTWANEHGVVGTQRLDLYHLVRAIDVEYLKWRARRDKQAQDKASKKPAKTRQPRPQKPKTRGSFGRRPKRGK